MIFGGVHSGGDDGIRTHDPLLAGQVLSQLSYTPVGVDLANGFRCRPLDLVPKVYFVLREDEIEGRKST